MLKAVRLQSFFKGKGYVSGKRLRSSETSFFEEGPMQLEESLVERDELLQKRVDAAGRKLWSRETSFFEEEPMQLEES